MDAIRGAPDGRLRIGELAALAETTTRAIRHYHAAGLLAEPERDASDYRRYGAEDLVRLVRVRRLRTLGLPLDRIAASLAGEQGPNDLPAALRSLADDISAEIDRLGAQRARVLDLAASGALAGPIATWQAELRRRGLLDEHAELPASEHAAVELLDVLHPDGIGGVVANASELLGDPSRVARLGVLLRRFQTLPDDAGEELVDALAADYAAALPRPDEPPPVDLDTIDRLVGDRLSSAQRRCLHRARELLEARDR